MTNEEKLLKLLEIAIKNDYDIGKLPHLAKCAIRFKPTLENHFIVSKIFSTCYLSLNDLILDYEENEISFIEALWKEVLIRNIQFPHTTLLERFSYEEILKITWSLQPTSKRLDCLFETFKELLC